jgi:hypothetical protein
MLDGRSGDRRTRGPDGRKARRQECLRYWSAYLDGSLQVYRAGFQVISRRWVVGQFESTDQKSAASELPPLKRSRPLSV